MKLFSFITSIRVYSCTILIVLSLSYGCCHSKHADLKEQDLEAEMVQIVREWCSANNLMLPRKIVIYERTLTKWLIVAESGRFEIGFDIDPNTKRIIRTIAEVRELPLY